MTGRQVWTGDQDKDNDDDITTLTKNSLYIRPSAVQSYQLQNSLKTAADEAKLFGANLQVKSLQDIKYFSDNNLSLITDHFAPLSSLELQEKCKVKCSFHETPDTVYLKLTIPEEFFVVLGQCIKGPRMPRVVYQECMTIKSPFSSNTFKTWTSKFDNLSIDLALEDFIVINNDKSQLKLVKLERGFWSWLDQEKAAAIKINTQPSGEVAARAQKSILRAGQLTELQSDFVNSCVEAPPQPDMCRPTLNAADLTQLAYLMQAFHIGTPPPQHQPIPLVQGLKHSSSEINRQLMSRQLPAMSSTRRDPQTSSQVEDLSVSNISTRGVCGDNRVTFATAQDTSVAEEERLQKVTRLQDKTQAILCNEKPSAGVTPSQHRRLREQASNLLESLQHLEPDNAYAACLKFTQEVDHISDMRDYEYPEVRDTRRAPADTHGAGESYRHSDTAAAPAEPDISPRDSVTGGLDTAGDGSPPGPSDAHAGDVEHHANLMASDFDMPQELHLGTVRFTVDQQLQGQNLQDLRLVRVNGLLRLMMVGDENTRNQDPSAVDNIVNSPAVTRMWSYLYCQMETLQDDKGHPLTPAQRQYGTLLIYFMRRILRRNRNVHHTWIWTALPPTKCQGMYESDIYTPLFQVANEDPNMLLNRLKDVIDMSAPLVNVTSPYELLYEYRPENRSDPDTRSLAEQHQMGAAGRQVAGEALEVPNTEEEEEQQEKTE